MLSKVLIYLLPFVLLETVTACPYDRCNDHESPAHWPGTCSSQVRGSPINLCGATPLSKFSVSTKFTKKYQSIESGKLIYDPTNLAFVVPKEKPCQLQTDFLPDFTSKKFATTNVLWNLEQVRMHVGRQGHVDEGSEHYIEGKQFTGELQFVHYNSKFASYAAALASGKPDALLIAAVPLSQGTGPVIPALTGLIDGLLRAVLALLNSLLGQLNTITSVTGVVAGSGSNGGLLGGLNVLGSVTGVLGGGVLGAANGNTGIVPGAGVPFGQKISVINQAFAAAGAIIETNSTVTGFVEIDSVRLASSKNTPLKLLLPSLAIPEAVDVSLSKITHPVVDTIKPLKPTLNAVIVPLSPLLNAVLCPLESVLTRVILVLNPALQPLVNSLGNVVSSLLCTLNPILQPILCTLDDVLNPVLGPLLHPVGALLNGLLDPVLGAVSPIVASLLSSLVPTLDTVLVPVAGTLGKVLLPVTPIVGSLVDQLTVTTQTVLGPVLSPATVVVGSLLQTSVTLVKTSIAGVAGALGIRVDQVTSFLGATVSQLTALLDLSSLLNFNGAHYIYPGSLTTFPCTESAIWVVLKEPLTISSELLAKLHNSHGTLSKKFNTQSMAGVSDNGNFRDLQSSYNRTIYSSFEYTSNIVCQPVSEPHFEC